ncbi:uncharacterized protein LY79DRAFT_35939 [Colletotrichum navitas]|uniref:Secreted protein n=1 Tax=Colletotrichum navitas TaxID=681940 RepID=A0AAD8Q6Y7_9PEZI|nr:uncharacterized protein LY79DRAFT_35939 [Colletotrichum navitas]KAK1596932.1 hypothetical protein LY79DRAFT_35939 [Colletotrichum navitas]
MKASLALSFVAAPLPAVCCRFNVHKWQFAERFVSDSNKQKGKLGTHCIAIRNGGWTFGYARSTIYTGKRKALPSHRLSGFVFPGPRNPLGSIRAKVESLSERPPNHPFRFGRTPWRNLNGHILSQLKGLEVC